MHIIGLALFDFLLLIISFFAIHLFKYGGIVIADRHDEFFVLILVAWALFSLILKKFAAWRWANLWNVARTILLNATVMAGTASLIIVMSAATTMSRALVYGTFALHAGLELIAFGTYFSSFGKPAPQHRDASGLTRLDWFNASPSLAMADALLLWAGFFAATWLKRSRFEWTDNNCDILFLLFGVWMVTTIVLRKFEKANFHSAYNLLALSIKSTLCMTAGLALLIFGLRYFFLSRGQIFGALTIFSVLELPLFYLYHRYRTYMLAEKDLAFATAPSSSVPAQRSLNLPATTVEPCHDPVDEKIRHALHFLEPDLYGFIRRHVDLTAIDSSRSAVMYTDKLLNLTIMAKGHHQLMVNLHKINDMRFLNQYFLLAHEKLEPQGYLVGKAHTLETHRSHFLKSFDHQYIGQILYGMDFVWNRICPKLPFVKKLYFALSGGRNRLLSRAEILGRLFYCGFRPLATEVISDRFYFIARKAMTPCQDPNPTYGPLVTLQRFGQIDKPLTVYKFRTMHPFSEYLQQYVYDQHQLEKGGKFKDDFRVTRWGALMRKLWIDELPMLYNWLRGDLQLVGVRPLSRQYLELYTPEHRALRKLVKPGLLPPFYADLPDTLEEIMASERRYIEAYLKQPIQTQLRYFFLCLYNILIKRKRSA